MRNAIWGLLLLLPFAGCFGSGPAANQTPSQTLIYGRGEDANTLDPIQAHIGESVKVLVNIFDTLVTYNDKTTELVPALATEWSNSEDGLTWTFTLREGATFQDGTPVDADAVVFSFNRILAEKGPPRPFRPSFDSIKEVAAAGKTTVVFTLHRPSALFLQNIAMFPASIVSPAAVAKHGDAFGQHPIGSGPFQLTAWESKQSLTLTRYDKHWRGLAGVEKVIFLSVTENASRARQLRAGESHIADDLNPTELDALTSTEGITVQEVPGLNVAYLTMQMEKGVLKHRDVRTAIATAIDKQALIKLAYGGKAEPAVNMVPKTMWGHNDAMKDREFDVAAAKKLMEECAQKEGFTLPVELSLAAMNQPRPYLPLPSEVGSFVKDSLKPIGIHVKIELRDVNEHFEYVKAGRHELALAGWYADNNDIDNFLCSLLHSDNIFSPDSKSADNGNNLSRYKNGEVDQLLKAGQSELDLEKRRELYRKAQELIFVDVPTVPLVHAAFRVAHTDQLQGYHLHPTGLVRLRTAHFGAAK